MMKSNESQLPEKSMLKLAQFYLFLNSSNVTDKDIDLILQGVDLNLKVSDKVSVLVDRYGLIGCTPLHLSYKKLNINAFNILVSKGADFNVKNKNGNTILHEVFLYLCSLPLIKWDFEFDNDQRYFVAKRVPFLKSILSAHIKYKNTSNPSDSNGLTHFHIACATNNLEAVQFFLSNGVSVNQAVIKAVEGQFEGYTPLHFAAQFGHLRVMDILLQYQADANLEDSKGRTPLHISLERNIALLDSAGKVYSVEKILSNELLLSLLLNHTNNTKLPALYAVSAMYYSFHAENWIVQEPNMNRSVSIDSQSWPGYTALHFAAEVNVNTVKILIKYGVNIEAKNATGISPFDMCMDRYNVENIFEILSLVPKWRDIVLSDGETKLVDLVFALKNVNEISNFLQKSVKQLNLFVPFNSPLWPGFTVLHLAILMSERTKCRLDYKTVAKRLIFDPDLTIIAECLKQSADVTVKDHRNWTPIHLAFHLKKMKTLDLLLKYHHRTKNFFDNNNLSHLHIACSARNQDLVEKLLWNEVDVNVVYNGDTCISHIYPGWTPLHVAVYNTDFEIAKLLIRFGADVHAVDKYGFTPIHGLQILPEGLSQMLFHTSVLHDVVVKDLELSYLHIACLSLDVNAVKKLLDLGVDVNKVFHKKIDNSDNLQSIIGLNDYDGLTPLHFAMENICLASFRERLLQLVTLLIERGADMLMKNSKKISVLEKILKEESDNFTDTILAILKRNDDLRKRVEIETGVTVLHIACIRGDVDLIKSLLNNGADVNAQIPQDSTIWPGYTPLHVLIFSFNTFVGDDDEDRCDYFNEMVKILLDYRADVTIMNAKRRTPLHMAYYNLYCYEETLRVTQISLMLKAQMNFEINHTSVEGISHFHMACHMLEVDIVENFLEYDVDVNSMINLFCDFEVAACTPLLLATKSWRSMEINAKKPLTEAVAQIQIVDLLIKHGAQVNNFEDMLGNSPAHYAADCSSTKANYLHLLANSGANVNFKNVRGITPLELLLKKKSVTYEEIRYFIACGCCFNAFNPVTEEGYVGRAATLLSQEDMQCLLYEICVTYQNFLNKDEMDRAVIHNLVSFGVSKIREIQYAELFYLLMKFGCDIDDQDKIGRTALHLAAQFRNEAAIAGLLLVGADLNVTEKDGKTPFAYVFEPCIRCNINDHEQFSHVALFKVFTTQIHRLQLCNLDVNEWNERLLTNTFNLFEFEDVVSDDDNFLSQIGHMSGLKIKPYSLNVMDFLSESAAVIDYPSMSQNKQKVVDAFFRASKNQFEKQYKEIAGVIQLQYRKAVLRMKIINVAQDSLSTLMKFRLPDLCSRIILRFLKNYELQNMIFSVCQSETTSMDVDD